jgi:hypothetical protein
MGCRCHKTVHTTVDPDAWLTYTRGRFYHRRITSKGSFQLGRQPYYVGTEYSGQLVAVTVRPALKLLDVLLGQTVLTAFRLLTRQQAGEVYVKHQPVMSKVVLIDLSRPVQQRLVGRTHLTILLSRAAILQTPLTLITMQRIRLDTPSA